MIRFLRNLELVTYDIKSLYTSYIYAKNKNKIDERARHKKEILYLYRHMLKEVPKLQDDLFESKQIYEEIKFNFREGSRETNLEVISHLRLQCYIIIEKINKGVYPPFPRFEPH